MCRGEKKKNSDGHEIFYYRYYTKNLKRCWRERNTKWRKVRRQNKEKWKRTVNTIEAGREDPRVVKKINGKDKGKRLESQVTRALF